MCRRLDAENGDTEQRMMIHTKQNIQNTGEYTCSNRELHSMPAWDNISGSKFISTKDLTQLSIGLNAVIDLGVETY
jgi:hypothetical protein